MAHAVKILVLSLMGLVVSVPSICMQQVANGSALVTFATVNENTPYMQCLDMLSDAMNGLIAGKQAPAVVCKVHKETIVRQLFKLADQDNCPHAQYSLRVLAKNNVVSLPGEQAQAKFLNPDSTYYDQMTMQRVLQIVRRFKQDKQ